MKKNKFSSIDKTKKGINLFIIGLGVIAIMLTGVAFASRLRVDDEGIKTMGRNAAGCVQQASVTGVNYLEVPLSYFC